MINISTNISEVMADITGRLNQIINTDTMLRTVAETMLGEVKQRIHVDGKDASGNQIGTYSSAYMKLRTGAFLNAGKNNSGFAIKGKKSVLDIKTRQPVKVKESLRINYSRTNDTKVIISLTRQMENDFSVIATSTGYGLGYNNEDNFKKVEYVETTYNKPIFKLTEEEHAKAINVAESYVDSII